MSTVPARGNRLRVAMVLAALACAMIGLAGRDAYLQLFRANYLQEQGRSRYLRVVKDVPPRGMILDRNGQPLAVSTPVDSIWAQPEVLAQARDRWPALARKLGMKPAELARDIHHYAGKEFMYLRRQVAPDYAKSVLALDVPGVSVVHEYRRYYPAGEATAHILGFTNIDDHGQEGLELAYDKWLSGKPGLKRVLKDRYGKIVESVDSISLPQRGKDLRISIDRRIQYLAYRGLKQAVEKHHARGGTAVVMDAHTGEILAMVSDPAFNPNNRADLRGRLVRNRSVTDVFEPGSTLKPFTITTALQSGKFTPKTLINTAPGSMRIGADTIQDVDDFGWLTVTRVIEKSSNVGAAKIALAIGKQPLYHMLRQLGFGQETGSGLPGEVSGVLRPPKDWARIDNATLAFGYGISVTTLQLARAYCVLANGGYLLTPSILPTDTPIHARYIVDTSLTRKVRAMLEAAVSIHGTGHAAEIPYYQVAGKTGTVNTLVDGRYVQRKHIALFAGFAPATHPRLVMVVTVENPTRNGYFGGQVAAPVFHSVMAGAMRLLNIAPDDAPPFRRQLAQVVDRSPT
jgi:cell division protein FtsI (penicillin-binding protein 3)